MLLFFEDCDFFSKLGKKSPKFHWEWDRISAPENTKKIPAMLTLCILETPEEVLLQTVKTQMKCSIM